MPWFNVPANTLTIFHSICLFAEQAYTKTGCTPVLYTDFILMIISFDLDDTLIPGAQKFDIEKRTLLQVISGVEPLRLGTTGLMKTLQRRGHKVYIYTSSLRPIHRIRWAFLTYGIRPDKIINLKIHNRALQKMNRHCSKYPPAFSIDIHIDDAPGVAIEGKRYGFQTIILTGDMPGWTDHILQRVAQNASADDIA